MKKSRIRTILIIFAIVVIACFGAILALCMDEAPPKDDDLQLVRPAVADEENAIWYFVRAAKKTYDPGNNWPDMLYDDSSWDADLVAELLDKNAETLGLLKKGLACTKAQNLEFRDGTDGTDIRRYFKPLRQGARLLSLRACDLAANGRPEKALDEALSILHLGRALQNCGGDYDYLRAGAAIKAVGLTRIRMLVSDMTVDPDLLRRYIAVLDSHRIGRKALSDTLKSEYAKSCDEIDTVRLGAGPDFMPLPEVPGFICAYSFKPNATKRKLAEACRICLSNVEKRFCDQTATEAIPEVQFRGDVLEYRLKLFLRRNRIGWMIYTWQTAALSEIVIAGLYDRNFVSAIQIVVALRCHQLKTGALPASLDELCPEYFGDVPVDWFDGKPLRYSPEKKLICSVGKDLTDDGGDEEKDITFKIGR